MALRIVSRSGKEIAQLTLADGATTEDLKREFQAKNKKYYTERQRFTLPTTGKERPVALVDGKTLKEQNVADVLVFKDLGPQISWKLVFVIEYLGPLLIFPVFFLRPTFIYGTNAPALKEQQISAFVAFMFHYTKRELETLFVHRFSSSTMPIMNVFKNSIYYWGFAASIAYFLFHPLYTPVSEGTYAVAMGFFYMFEIANLVTHIELAKLRPKGTKVRRIPYGGLFEYVSCPNYLYEISAWICYSIFTSTLTCWVFATVGAVQMIVWAKKKHMAYRKEFNGQNGVEMYPPARRILIPFIF